MSKKDTLTEKTGVVVFARVLNTLIDLALVIAVVHILSKTEFAVIGYLLMVHEIARNVATIGFPESIFYYFERVAKTARKAFVVQTIAILCGLALVAGLAMVGISYILPSLLSGWQPSVIQTVQHLLPLMALVTVLEVPTWPVTNILLASDEQKHASWYEVSTSLLSFICVVGPLLLGYSLTAVVYGLITYAAVRFAGSAIWMWAVLPERVDSRSGITVKEQFKFSLPLGTAGLVGKINRYVDKFIVSILLAASAFAEYSIAAQQIPVLKVIPLAVGSVLISRYVRLQIKEKREELLALWHKGIEKVSLLVVPLTILFIISASDLIAILAGSQNTSYQNAVIPFQIYNLIMLIRVTHYGSILQAFDDTRGVMYLSINLVIANIILTVPLTIYFGIIGAAAGTLIANLYNWVMYLRRIGWHMDISPMRVLPFKFYLRVLAVAIIVGLPVWISRSYLIPDQAAVMGLIYTVVVFLPLFGGIGSAVNIITRKDWADLRNWLSLKFMK